MFDVAFTEFYNPMNLLWGDLDFPEIDLSAFGLAYPFAADLEPVADLEDVAIVTQTGFTGAADVLPDAGLDAGASATPVIVADAAVDPAPAPAADPLVPTDATAGFDNLSLNATDPTAEPLLYEVDYAAVDLTILQIGQSFNAFSHLI